MGHVEIRWDPSEDDQRAEKSTLRTGIDTGIVLYRYPLANSGTELMGIDTGFLLYRYRGLYTASFDLPRVLTSGRVKYPDFRPN